MMEQLQPDQECHLKQLRISGDHRWDMLPDKASLPGPPDDFDLEKFERGKKFFQHHLFSCTFAMLISLISGLSVSNLLDPLVFTGQSDTPSKSIRRYFSTFHHILQWHFGNVWDPTTRAHNSITKVRHMHNNVRRAMADSVTKTRNTSTCYNHETAVDCSVEDKSNVWVSQYDMSLVQCGFMGCIVMYPEQVGIRCTMSDLSDYCYFWYGIGHLLGISPENNICSYSPTQTLSICKEIENDILIPAMQNPPDMFLPMANAFVDGVNLLCHVRMHSLEAFLALSYHLMGRPVPKLSFIDFLRFWFLRLQFLFVKYCSVGRNLMNRAICLTFDVKSMT
jgi:hypothetical protein